MITIEQLLESVDLDFEPRFITQDEDGEIWIWNTIPDQNTKNWCLKNGTQKPFRGRLISERLKVAEFDGKDWTECIYEVPRKTTGKIYKFDSSAIDTLYDSNPEKFKKFICGEIVCKLNEVIDAVNELRGEE